MCECNGLHIEINSSYFTLFLMFPLMSCVKMEWRVLGQLFVFELGVVHYFYGSSDWGPCVERGSHGMKCT